LLTRLNGQGEFTAKAFFPFRGGAESQAIATDAAGNAYITGAGSGDLFMPGGDTIPQNGGASDFFIAKWGADTCPRPDTAGGEDTTRRAPHQTGPGNSLQLYPNPASGRTALRYRFKGPARVVIRDLMGRPVRRLQPLEGRGRRELSLRALSAGVYTLTAYPADGHPIVKRLVVQE
jgi:hypothetical protein